MSGPEAVPQRPGRGAPMRPSERLAAAGFLVACGLAAAAFLAPLDAGPGAAPDVALPSVPAPAEPSAYLAALPFDPARRAATGWGSLPPPPGAEPALSVEAPPPPAVAEGPPVLAGVLVGPGSRRAAFRGSGGVWQGVGSTVGGWTVSAIEPGRVRLLRGGEELVLGASEAIAGRAAFPQR